ncbi:MAG TPA: hypothetical protein VJA94_08455 [Candidatus Angelobacter sp.]
MRVIELATAILVNILAFTPQLCVAQNVPPQLRVEVRLLGQKFTENFTSAEIAEIQNASALKIAEFLQQQVPFLKFSAANGDAVLHFQLNSIREQSAQGPPIPGNPQEIDLFVSLDGSNVELGGHDAWLYRDGQQHGEAIGTKDNVEFKISQCVQLPANLQNLLSKILSRVVVGKGGVLQVGPSLQWILPFAKDQMCGSPEDTTFSVVHEGSIQGVTQRPRAFVAGVGYCTSADCATDPTLSNHWVGALGSAPPEIDAAMRDRIQREMERIKSAPAGSLAVKEIYVLVYGAAPDPTSCGQTFSPGTSNLPAGGPQ